MFAGACSPPTATKTRCHRSRTWYASRGGEERRCTYEGKRRAETSSRDVTQQRRGKASRAGAGVRRGRDRDPRAERARRRARPVARRRVCRHDDVPASSGEAAKGPRQHHAGCEGRPGDAHQLFPRLDRTRAQPRGGKGRPVCVVGRLPRSPRSRSEEHTSELQSHLNLVCRLLLEKKKKTHTTLITPIKKNKKKTVQI